MNRLAAPFGQAVEALAALGEFAVYDLGGGLGARYTYGAGRIDAGLLFGTTTRDPGIGFTVGYTYVFNAIKAP